MNANGSMLRRRRSLRRNQSVLARHRFDVMEKITAKVVPGAEGAATVLGSIGEGDSHLHGLAVWSLGGRARAGCAEASLH